MRQRRLLLILLAVPLLSACGPVRYLSQAAAGQWALVRGAKPIPDVLADPRTPAEVQRKLQLVTEVRDFAHQELGLPERGSYRQYVDLGRPYVVWNVFSAPEFSTTLRTTCFPVVGCVAYQGYFQEAEAKREGERRRAAGDDVLVGGITAYSTLGYLRDPVLSSMFTHSDAWLIRTIIHELSHPTLYVPGDTVFNESYATAIENEGMRRWVKKHASTELAAQDATEQQRSEGWRKLSLAARQELEALYALPLPDAEKRQRKTAVLDALQTQATALRREWFGPDAAPAARQSNASLGAVAAYADLVPDFEQLLKRVNGDLPAFIQAAKECAKQPKDKRAACLRGE